MRVDGDLPQISAQVNPPLTYPDMHSEAEIIKQHDKLIRYLCEPFVAFVMDDLVQEARIALLLAARRYDPARGVELWTYARKFVLGAVLRVVTKELERTEAFAERYDEADTSKEGSPKTALPASTETPEDITTAREIVTKALATLTDRELVLIKERFDKEQDFRAVASSMGISEAYVRQLLANSLVSMRERAA